MAFCPYCKEDKPGTFKFCPDCGARLDPAPLIDEHKGDVGLDRSARQAQSQTVIVSPSEAIPRDYCPICGLYVRLDTTFRCTRCRRIGICLDHRDPALRVCSECAADIRREAEDKARREARAEGALEETFRPVRPKAEADAAEQVRAAQPAQHWVTTYRAGENAYDESFPIEADDGEYLGECGVGISEMLGAPEPVAAFEVWLFDRSDSRTVTKVLLSEHAYRDEALRTKLSAKGEIMLAEVSGPFVLETANLRIEGQITDLAYDTHDELPKGVISKLTIELDMKPKETVSDLEELA